MEAILSNTPTEVIFDDNPRRNSLIFAVHMWNPMGKEPDSILEVLHRQGHPVFEPGRGPHRAPAGEPSPASRHQGAFSLHSRERAQHRRRSRSSPPGAASRACTSCAFSPQSLDNEDHTKDVDFSPWGIRQRWEAGYADTQRAIEQAPWQGEFDPLDGVILHDPPGEMPLKEVAQSSMAPMPPTQIDLEEEEPRVTARGADGLGTTDTHPIRVRDESQAR